MPTLRELAKRPGGAITTTSQTAMAAQLIIWDS